MSKHSQKVFDAFNDISISFKPIYSRILGHHINGALLLSQLCYWHTKMKGTEFYKTDSEIRAETELGEHELRNAKQRLVEYGFVAIVRKGVPAKSFYTVNVQNIMQAIEDFSLPKADETSENASYAETAEVDSIAAENAGPVTRVARDQLRGNRGTTTVDYTEDYTEEDLSSSGLSIGQVIFMQETWNTMAEKIAIERIEPIKSGNAHTIGLDRIWAKLKLEGWNKLIDCMADSPWLGKENPKNWRASFEWITNDKNLEKILSGKFRAYASACEPNTASASPKILFPRPPQFLNTYQDTGQCYVFWDTEQGGWKDAKNCSWQLDEDKGVWEKDPFTN